MLLAMAKILSIGDCFDVWKGGFSCPGDRVAVMAWVALSGYHSISTYQWYRESEVLVDVKWTLRIWMKESTCFQLKVSDDVYMY